MTDSDHTSSIPMLSKEVRRMRSLWSAWISVRSKALHSKNEETRKGAQAVEENPHGVLRGLQESLRNGSFAFEPQKAVLKQRKGKTPRPLVIAPVANRIVQRSILDTLQSDRKKIQQRLGAIPESLFTPTSVGGLPGKGAPQAVEIISAAIANGAKYFVRSDIKDFFTGVPTADLISWIEKTTGEPEFAELIRRGLKVELANADDPKVKEWRSLFPDDKTGVPQGSSLAAFCANVTLADFDRQLNQNGLTTVRYIDDFVILGSTEKAVNCGWKIAAETLHALGLEAWKPNSGSDKASRGRIENGFSFLSMKFTLDHVAVTKSARDKLLSEIDSTIRSAQRDIQTSLGATRRAEARFTQTLAALDRQIRGWGDSFKSVSLRLQFSQMDDEIDKKLARFIGWYSDKTKSAEMKKRRRALGVALLSDTPKD